MISMINNIVLLASFHYWDSTLINTIYCLNYNIYKETLTLFSQHTTAYSMNKSPPNHRV